MRTLALALLLAAPAAAQNEEEYGSRRNLLSTGGIGVFFDLRGPLSYNTTLRSGLPPGAVPTGSVYGRACQHGLYVPVLSLRGGPRVSGGGGKGGYDKALERIKETRPDLRGIYDVKVDQQVTSVFLGVYQRLCTEIRAEGFR